MGLDIEYLVKNPEHLKELMEAMEVFQRAVRFKAADNFPVRVERIPVADPAVVGITPRQGYKVQEMIFPEADATRPGSLTARVYHINSDSLALKVEKRSYRIHFSDGAKGA